jgi:hypothetical protein
MSIQVQSPALCKFMKTGSDLGLPEGKVKTFAHHIGEAYYPHRKKVILEVVTFVTRVKQLADSRTGMR